jgi:beta-carotene 3-hydroxylase
MDVLWITTAGTVAVGMEWWARFLHGVVWHGPMWAVHESHHVPRTGWFERNDVFAALHAAVAIVLIVGSCLSGDGTAENVAFGVGIGMTAFGVSYFLVHDGYVHERLPLGFLSRWAFFRRLRGAHLAHHKTGNAPYGLFLGPRELRRSQR